MFLNISTIGLVVQNELYLDPKMIDAKAAVNTINDNRGRIYLARMGRFCRKFWNQRTAVFSRISRMGTICNGRPRKGPLNKAGSQIRFQPIYRAHAAPNGVVIDLATTMGKFLLLGLSVGQVLEKVTANPARILNSPERVGSLQADGIADISVIEEQQGDFTFLDSTRQKRMARQRLAPVAVVRRGELIMAS